MKILHAPYNIVNIPYLISREFRKMGHTCDVMSLYNDHRKHDSADYVLFKGTALNPEKGRFDNLKLISFTTKAILKYDIFQFHQRNSLLPINFDIQAIRLLKKKYFIYHHGSDVIGNDNYLKHVPHSKWAEAIFVSTPDLYDFVPKSAILIPQAISMDYLQRFTVNERQFGDCGKDPITITHAIHSEKGRRTKGSEIIIDAIEKLNERGLKIDFRFFIGKEHDFILREIAQADIHIDQMHYGWHGTISAEAMALGTPAMCYIRPDLEEFGENMPIFRADKSNLVERLEQLIQDVGLRKQLSAEGRKYVAKVHDAPQVAKKIWGFYNIKFK